MLVICRHKGIIGGLLDDIDILSLIKLKKIIHHRVTKSTEKVFLLSDRETTIGQKHSALFPHSENLRPAFTMRIFDEHIAYVNLGHWMLLN